MVIWEKNLVIQTKNFVKLTSVCISKLEKFLYGELLFFKVKILVSQLKHFLSKIEIRISPLTKIRHTIFKFSLFFKYDMISKICKSYFPTFFI